jgi:Flp pilus assembly protein TadD
LTLHRQHEEARQEFEAALRVDPMLYEAHYFYARVCVTEGKFAEAVSQYREAWRVRPADYQAIYLSASPLMKLGRRDEALDAIRQAIKLADAHLELNPDDARAWNLSAGGLMQLGQPDQAVERVRRALAIDPRESYITRAVSMLWRATVTKRWITWIRRSRMGLAIENGWRTIRIGIPFGASGFKPCCKSFSR